MCVGGVLRRLHGKIFLPGRLLSQDALKSPVPGRVSNQSFGRRLGWREINEEEEKELCHVYVISDL